MVKKIVLFAFAVVLILSGWVTYCLFGSATAFTQPSRFLYIPTRQATYTNLLNTLKDSQYLKYPGFFDRVARQLDLPEKVIPGRYEIKKNMSLMALVKMLQNGHQSPVNLVITKLRTRENLAALAGRKLECDSATMMSFLESNDSLSRYGLDSNTVMSAVFPNTYSYFWNSTPSAIFNKFFNYCRQVWNEERKHQAARLGITATQAYILASIVEEETNALEEKDTIASVYLNRYRKGIRLQADPTIKFALGDFSIRRIYVKHLTVNSPYNTYRYPGFPPGPICTPSLKTLDAVLNAPDTRYLYFVAKSDFSGRHVFTENYQQHLVNARAFQEALTREQQKSKAAREDIDVH